ncbi:thioredoxin [Clostridium sp. AM58-1XD]|uniref:thioredoxin n=1 Tax=Clostridium sp. AM58-1XD TaxID=2292307 RepID=UPI000E4ADF38|nr:thioredoxin [Clostridium sp. AM58-1XD]RGY97373.1 thioredoxin [Clostridium sp. AM58-1XD]
MTEIITTENFDGDVLQSGVPVLVDFYADWCGPCKMMAPVVDQIAEEYAGKVKVGKLNVDEQPEIAGRYGVMSIPTIIIFHGGEVVTKLVGVQPKKMLTGTLDSLI